MIGFPFDSHVTYDAEGNPIYDRAISSAPYRKLLRELFKTGIMPTDSSNMQVAAGEGMSVIVNPGFAMVEGCMKLEEEVTNLSIQASDSALDRIDTVVLRLDSNENVRSCEFAVISGVPSLVPIRPELTRNESIYEIGLADVLISKTVTVISDSKITDTRFDNERCGVVSSISEFDTTTLNQQMVAWSREQREEFSAWVDSIKDILDESTAGHLQSEIDELKESAGGAKEMISDEYNATKTYNAGEICIDNNILWKSKIDNNRGNTPAEGTYWTATSVGNSISKLTAQDGLEFNFQVDNDGNYGILNKEGEFMSFAKENIDCYYSQTNTKPANFVLPTDCKVGYVYGWNTGWNATNPQFTVTANKGTLTKLFSRSEGSGQGSANGFGVYKLENAPSGTTLNFTYGTGGNSNSGGFTVVISK